MDKIKKYFPIISGVLISTIFGLSFLFTKLALIELEDRPFQLLAYRFAIAAIILTILRLMGKVKVDFTGKRVHILFLLAFFQPISYFICETIGIRLTSSSEAGMMTALMPVIVTILASIILKEKTSRSQIIFIIISVSGVLFINIMKGGATGNYIGGIVLFLAVLSGSFYNILSRKSSLQFKPEETTFVMMWVGAIVFNGVSIIKHIYHGNLSDYFVPLSNIKLLIPVLYLGVLSSIVAFFLFNYMLSKLEASRAAVFANLTTVVSILAGVFILKESFYWYQGIGGIVILIGVWGTNYFSIPRKIKE
ncbi:DMT family transporter [Clostridiisalibacter paucivorans]|uniref:DMT family transporter n=1 Tax=Clostridiisalibacter paucivorans TaxID=408753 RepID=UPI00047DC69A|nr:DMT family transporter [Clostridiisalibacter paucivorans]